MPTRTGPDMRRARMTRVTGKRTVTRTRAKLGVVRGGGRSEHAPPGAESLPEPGVYEEEIHAPGERWFKILMPSGKVGIVHMPDEFDDILPVLVRLCEEKTFTRNRAALRVIRSADIA